MTVIKKTGQIDGPKAKLEDKYVVCLENKSLSRKYLRRRLRAFLISISNWRIRIISEIKNEQKELGSLFC